MQFPDLVDLAFVLPGSSDIERLIVAEVRTTKCGVGVKLEEVGNRQFELTCANDYITEVTRYYVGKLGTAAWVYSAMDMAQYSTTV